MVYEKRNRGMFVGILRVCHIIRNYFHSFWKITDPTLVKPLYIMLYQLYLGTKIFEKRHTGLCVAMLGDLPWNA